MVVAQDREQDLEAAGERGGEEVAADAHVERPYGASTQVSFRIRVANTRSSADGEGILVPGWLWAGDMLTISRLVEAMAGVAMGREDRDFVAALLQSDGGVDDEPLGATDAEVGVEEDDALGGFGGAHGEGVAVGRGFNGMS